METIDIFKEQLLLLHSQALSLIKNQRYVEFDNLFLELKSLLRKNADILDLAILDDEVRSAQLDLQRCVSKFFMLMKKNGLSMLIKPQLQKRH